MAKYDPLKRFLEARTTQSLPMSFAEVEKVLGAKLPSSASAYQAWWANEATGSHVQARSWMAAGYQTEQVDLAARHLVFKRTQPRSFSHATIGDVIGKKFQASGLQEDTRMFKPTESATINIPPGAKLTHHPAFGAMKGMFTIEPGYDITKPVYSDAEWKEIEKEMEADWDQIYAPDRK